MTQKFVFVIVILAALLGGCDRLGEKDKMEIIGQCESAAKSFSALEQGIPGIQDSVLDPQGNDKISYVSHYSFSKKRCFVLQYVEAIGPDNLPTSVEEYVLYDGVTKERLRSLQCGDLANSGKKTCLLIQGRIYRAETTEFVEFSKGLDALKSTLITP